MTVRGGISVFVAWDDDVTALDVQPSVGSIAQLTDDPPGEPVERNPIGFVWFGTELDKSDKLR